MAELVDFPVIFIRREPSSPDRLSKIILFFAAIFRMGSQTGCQSLSLRWIREPVSDCRPVGFLGLSLAEFGRTRLGYGTTGMFLYPHYGGRAGGCGRWLTLRGEWRIDRSLSRCKLLAVESVKPKCPCSGKSMGIWRIVPRLPGWLRANRGPMVRKRSDSAGASVID